MLEDFEKCKLPDQSNARNDLDIDIDPKKDTIDVRVGDKKAVIKKKDLFSLAFVIADPDEQADMVPIKQTKIRKYKRQYRIKAAKDIKKGEDIIFSTEFDVPLEVYNGLAKDIFERSKKNSKLILPQKYV